MLIFFLNFRLRNGVKFCKVQHFPEVFNLCMIGSSASFKQMAIRHSLKVCSSCIVDSLEMFVPSKPLVRFREGYLN